MPEGRRTLPLDDFDAAGLLYDYSFGGDGFLATEDAAPDWEWNGFALTDAGGTQPAIAYLLPLDASDVRPGIKGAVAGLFIARPRRNGLPPADLLQSLFGLTPAEARVMQMIGCGLRPADIARHLDNSENTVKSQLARVYAKMGASSQMEIARIIADLAPPFRQGN